MSNSHKTKKIAINTIVLYIRMLIVMIINLFTSRIVLRELGVEDFGLYNVVGGVVTLFAFLRSSMSSSTQRFLSYEMGKGNSDNLQHIFSICLFSHVVIAIVLLLLAETIGLWFLNNQINIPQGRENAANWIYQSSIASMVFSLISIPYTADIISNEKMGYFAFLGVLDAVMKLVIAYLLVVSPGDRLIFYGFLIMTIDIVNLLLNWFYCHMRCAETHYKWYWEKKAFVRVFSFSGWTIWGQLAVVGANQGTNILVNIFYSVTVNAAMGIGMQVNNAITGLVSNFQTAFKPQLTKSYAEGDNLYLNSLIILSTKISFFLLYLVSLPIMININMILSIWLINVPLYAPTLCLIFIISKFPNVFSIPLQTLINASGKIKKLQIAISLSFFFELVLMLLLFYMDINFILCMTLKILANIFILYYSLKYAKEEISVFRIKYFTKKIIIPFSFILVGSLLVIIYTFNNTLTSIQSGIITIVTEILAIIICYNYGLNQREKNQIKTIIIKK